MIIRSWLKTLKYLPDFMRDFHDQKDLFKAMHQLYSKSENLNGTNIDWISGHIYTIDIFLWFMARHGYTLQKNRTKIEFDDINKTIDEMTKKRNDSFGDSLHSITKDQPHMIP